MTTRRLLLILICLALPAAADDKAQSLDALFDSYDAKNGNIENLMSLRYAVNDAIIETATQSLDIDSLPQFGSGDKTVIEFSDYQCGYCRRMFPSLAVAADGDTAKVVILEFPILGALSEKAARYALVAHNAGRFSDYHRYLMRDRYLSEDTIAEAAERAGLNPETLEEDAYAPAIDAQLEKNFQLAILLGVSGTPAFIIDDKLFRGAIGEDDFNRLLTQ